MTPNIKMNSVVSTILLGAFLFVIPLVLLFAVVKHAITILRPVAEWINQVTALHSLIGPAALTTICILLILLLSYVSGKLIERGIIKEWSKKLEDKLILLFPTFQMMKFQFLKGTDRTGNWKPILLREESQMVVAFLTGETKEYYSVYIPDAPRIDTGELRYVKKDACTYHPISHKEAVQCLTSFGRRLNVDEYIQNEID